MTSGRSACKQAGQPRRSHTRPNNHEALDHSEICGPAKLVRLLEFCPRPCPSSAPSTSLTFNTISHSQHLLLLHCLLTASINAHTRSHALSAFVYPRSWIFGSGLSPSLSITVYIASTTHYHSLRINIGPLFSILNIVTLVRGTHLFSTQQE